MWKGSWEKFGKVAGAGLGGSFGLSLGRGGEAFGNCVRRAWKRSGKVEVVMGGWGGGGVGWVGGWVDGEGG